MEILISTAKNDTIYLAIRKNGVLLKENEFEARHRQAELLLQGIDGLLKEMQLELKDVSKILVANKGEGFTALRIGIITANALGYALGIPVSDFDGVQSNNISDFSVVKPIYDREPNITCKQIGEKVIV